MGNAIFTIMGVLSFGDFDNHKVDLRPVAIQCDAEGHCEAEIWGKQITLEECLDGNIYVDGWDVAPFEIDTCSANARVATFEATP